MKKAMAICCLSGLMFGCANQPPNNQTQSGNQILVLDQTVQPMERVEVINAIKDCQSTGLRAVMIYSKKKINNYSTPIVVDVTCAPN